jgi:hypothetical protein
MVGRGLDGALDVAHCFLRFTFRFLSGTFRAQLVVADNLADALFHRAGRHVCLAFDLLCVAAHRSSRLVFFASAILAVL